MTTKIARDARAFAKRVSMSSLKLWVIVEGKNHDRPFYERVLETHPQARAEGHRIRLAEQIELDGVSAGGKDFAHKLLQFYDSENLLVQQSRSGARVIGFALDRDFDHLDGSLSVSPHVIYTEAADVEAEILVNGDVRRAICSAYSLTRESIETSVPSAGRPLADQLAMRWQEWITIGALAVCCGVNGGITYAHRSSINVDAYGEVDPNRFDDLIASIESSALKRVDAGHLRKSRNQIDAIFARGDGWSLVKGKWLASFAWHLVTVGLADTPRVMNVSAETLTRTCLETVEFGGQWADRYRSHFGGLLAI